MIITNCSRCDAVCASTCDLCPDCRARLESNVKSALIRAGWEVSGNVTIMGEASRPPRVVREIDHILARHNRQEARARRRRPVAWGRVSGFVLVGLGCLGLTWGFMQICAWIGEGIVAWAGGK